MAFKVINVDWKKERDRLTQLREKVFVCQWRIPRDVEFDQYDALSFHVLIVDEQGDPVATGRITPDGQLGRIAVVNQFRQPETYNQLFKALLKVAKKQKLEALSVQCELEGVSYYQQQGFQPVGSVYMDAGIPRQRMACPVKLFNLSHVEYTH
ncbi:GNAT family N-acetyltransferase [Alteromonadaceae bacterium BrNp21-10]|nr:GNAT family N-acetyltransferase [Alteromonadaceae bacterium BrNp21-10]